jgi:hypothetical protein
MIVTTTMAFEGNEFKTTETWKLSADSKTITIDQVMPMYDGDMKLKLVYDKNRSVIYLYNRNNKKVLINSTFFHTTHSSIILPPLSTLNLFNFFNFFNFFLPLQLHNFLSSE